MVEDDLDTKRVENTGGKCTQSGSLRREPSFSRWCDEDGKLESDHHLRNIDARVEDSDFELPLVQQVEIEPTIVDTHRYFITEFKPMSIPLSGGDSMDDTSIHVERDRKETYEPFDIENESAKKINVADGSISCHNPKQQPEITKNLIYAPDILKTLFFILVWYTFSLFLTLYNKSLLGKDLGKFPAPLLMNTVHFTMQAVLSKSITWYWSERFQTSVVMSWRDYFMRVVPTALGTAMDINLSNASLVSISVTFATMCKSGAPIFLLLFAFAFRLESPSIKLSGIILVISLGILLTVAKETEFELGGFILVMLAAVMSGFRWCMTQILLQKETYGLKNPLTLMSYVTPVMAVATGILSLMLDPWNEFRKNDYFNNPWHVTRSCLLMLLGGTLAFFMVLTEYILVSVTSAVTVTIAGVVKEAVTILVAVIYFGDEFTWLKGAGLFIIIIGVSLFNWYKYNNLQKHHHTSEDTESSTTNVAAKYVILEEMDELDNAS
ncbi:probable sugar phosphate/phosphate translocator At1g06470 [Humulus lupulus]|uniref:probable sugar phosphate/phosphate translocator At1g06470 n=1 Tax=Humulus lupulus TaxID=3486 RepID=UPI002B405BB9|nr:probable sugar phosphate/phosphate translocator At1g06470 [Humulus lupulus]